MRVAWFWSVIGVAVCLSGPLAASRAQAQAYVKGNDTGGIIPWSCENEAAARELAGAHCAGYRKYARITALKRQYGEYISFHCLWNPRMARFSIPRERTRSVCHEQVRIRARY
ncbi:MAG: hypothetical protein QOC56_1369 [Alphaproteobacteria bacterium]|jgi:hypothetical protein|nr:hypothetical protein [Alphaproteobacteria bacterium]MEA2937865.1 hypothetical protein [Alphaproteobacteria bacterium]